MSKHTPGDWELFGWGRLDELLITVSGTPIGKPWITSALPDDEIRANAKIMAAAPALFEALFEVEWSGMSYDEDGEEISSCPWCGAAEADYGKHHDGCKLAAALGKVRGE